MKNITLRMVAAEAGVSLSTASAALQGLNIVKESTRKKVEIAAQKLNYRRNSAASVLSSLRNRNSQKQAFIVWLSGYFEEVQKDGDWNTAQRYAKKEAQRLGLQFEARNIEDPKKTLQIIREIEARGCDGIIWGTNNHKNIPSIPWDRFFIISTDESRLKEGFDIVLANQFRSTIELLRHIKEVGYNRIGVCLRDHPEIHFDDEVRFGAVSAFNHYHNEDKHFIPPMLLPLNNCNSSAQLIDWVKKYKPEVVVGFSAEDLQIYRAHGFRIPEDFAYVALHVTNEDRGAIAGRKHNKEVISEYAVRVLLNKIRQGRRGYSAYPLETEVIPPLVAGASCPRLISDLKPT